MAGELVYRWNPFVRLVHAGHELRVWLSNRVNVISEPADANVFEEMARKGWFDSPEFTVPSYAELSVEVQYIIEQLLVLRVLTKVSGAGSNSLVDEYCARSGFRVSIDEGVRNLDTVSVECVGDNDLANAVADHLSSEGVSVVEDIIGKSSSIKAGNRLPILIGIFDDLFGQGALDLNRKLQQSDVKTLGLFVGRFDGEFATIGPWIVSGRSACLECWKLRRQANMPSIPVEYRPSGDARRKTMGNPTNGIDSILKSVVLDHIFEYAILRESAVNLRPSSFETISLSGDGLKLERHHVLRVPRCPVCSKTSSDGYKQVWAHG